MVAQLPDIDNITMDYDKAISQIREMYDGMTSYQQKFVKSDDLQTLQKYEERIFSRTAGNYTPLKIFGDDIRIKKKFTI